MMTLNLPLENMMSAWDGIAYAELSVALVYLKALYEQHHNNHWISRGDAFYGDHLLFQRLYEKTFEEVDMMAEKVLGVGSEENVDIERLTMCVNQVLTSQGASIRSTIPNPDALAEKSLLAERSFLGMLDAIVQALKEKSMLTRGIDNLIAQIQDTHETHIYLLRRRTS